jgi:hypothetical protein
MPGGVAALVGLVRLVGLVVDGPGVRSSSQSKLPSAAFGSYALVSGGLGSSMSRLSLRSSSSWTSSSMTDWFS